MNVSPHVHRAHVDSFFVLEREFTFERAGEEVVLGPGSYALAPPLLVHGFRPGNGRVLNIHTPGRYWVRNRIAKQEGRRIRSEEYDSHDPPPDGGLPRSEAVVVVPGDGELLERADRRLRILAARPELCMFLFDVDPGYAGPSTHVHRRHIDAFYVLDGTLEFELDGARTNAPAGTFVAATPGITHTFRNASDRPARFLNLHAPGVGFDEYLRRKDASDHGRAFDASFDVYEAGD